MSVDFPLAETAFTYTDAVVAMGGDPNSLRAWLRKNEATGKMKIELRSIEEGGWRRFSWEDIALLTLTRVLADFGIPVETANTIANNVLPKSPGSTPRQYEDICDMYDLVVMPRATPKDVKRGTPPEQAGVVKAVAYSNNPQKTVDRAWAYRIIARPHSPDLQPPAAIVVRIGRVVRETFVVLREIDEASKK